MPYFSIRYAKCGLFCALVHFTLFFTFKATYIFILFCRLLFLNSVLSGGQGAAKSTAWGSQFGSATNAASIKDANSSAGTGTFCALKYLLQISLFVFTHHSFFLILLHFLSLITDKGLDIGTHLACDNIKIVYQHSLEHV